MNETLVVSDTNIFLDLISVNLLKDFFCLPSNFSTGILDRKKAADLLEQLTKINMRLPKNECEKRISNWRN